MQNNVQRFPPIYPQVQSRVCSQIWEIGTYSLQVCSSEESAFPFLTCFSFQVRTYIYWSCFNGGAGGKNIKIDITMSAASKSIVTHKQINNCLVVQPCVSVRLCPHVFERRCVNGEGGNWCAKHHGGNRIKNNNVWSILGKSCDGPSYLFKELRHTFRDLWDTDTKPRIIW